MGLDVNGVRFLCHAHALGVDFRTTAMIGRQGLHLSARQLGRVLSESGKFAGAADHLLAEAGGYAEPLLRALGAAVVDSFDCSAFEGATCRHDFNSPIPEQWHGRYTAVLDGGSLEHVFHFPTALQNCMKMLAVGGHFLGITPANNFLGHGFYQVSPELYWRAFDPANGFLLEHMFAFEQRANPRWYAVDDPAVLRRRVKLVNARPTYLLVLARKLEDRPLFATPPVQSDYARAWQGQDRRPGARAHAIAAGTLLDRWLPPALRDTFDLLNRLLFRRTFDSRFFRPVSLGPLYRPGSGASGEAVGCRVRLKQEEVATLPVLPPSPCTRGEGSGVRGSASSPDSADEYRPARPPIPCTPECSSSG